MKSIGALSSYGLQQQDLQIRHKEGCLNNGRQANVPYYIHIQHIGVETIWAQFADDKFKYIFVTENFWFSNKSSLKYVP